jgi:hypothetical protein
MTKWADPIENPKQNERYWQEVEIEHWIFGIVIVVSYVTALAWMCWDMHRTVGCITGEISKVECNEMHKPKAEPVNRLGGWRDGSRIVTEQHDAGQR